MKSRTVIDSKTQFENQQRKSSTTKHTKSTKRLLEIIFVCFVCFVVQKPLAFSVILGRACMEPLKPRISRCRERALIFSILMFVNPSR